MRILLLNALLLAATATPALAAEAAQATEPVNLLSPHGGLMFWTLAIFLVLLVVLSKFAFKPILAAVEAREHHLQSMLDEATRDREQAAALLAEQQAALTAARGDAQKFIADSRAAAEKIRHDLLVQTRQEQQAILERARGEIAVETERAVATLRREAVDLAIAGAGKVIARNLDDAENRRIIDGYLASLTPAGR